MVKPPGDHSAFVGVAVPAATNAPTIAVENAVTQVATRHPALTTQHMIPRGHSVPMTASPSRPFPNRSDSAAVEEYMKKMGATDQSLYCMCCGQASDAHHINRFRYCRSTCWRCGQTHPGTVCGTWDNLYSQSWWSRHLGYHPRLLRQFQRPGEMLAHIRFRATESQIDARAGSVATPFAGCSSRRARNRDKNTHLGLRHSEGYMQYSQPGMVINIYNAGGGVINFNDMNTPTAMEPRSLPAAQASGRRRSGAQRGNRYNPRGCEGGQQGDFLHRVHDGRIERRSGNQARPSNNAPIGNASNTSNTHSQGASQTPRQSQHLQNVYPAAGKPQGTHSAHTAPGHPLYPPHASPTQQDRPTTYIPPEAPLRTNPSSVALSHGRPAPSHTRPHFPRWLAFIQSKQPSLHNDETWARVYNTTPLPIDALRSASPFLSTLLRPEHFPYLDGALYHRVLAELDAAVEGASHEGDPFHGLSVVECMYIRWGLENANEVVGEE